MNAKKAKQIKNKKNKANGSVPAQPNLIEDSYDDLPYESYVYPQTHPDRLHTIAKLFALNPPSLKTARVLELGCAGGGNIIPVAMMNPKMKFHGIDLSSEQISHANANKKAMGLKNIEFQQCDILKLPKNLGEFDYIICHGVFSWVPVRVRDEIFAICRRHLSKNGMAVISFNTLPGWAAIRSLRDMMLYHTRNFKDPKQQIHEARQLLGFLHENSPQANEAYRSVIERELKILKGANDSYLFHEHLELENNQYYLHEFVKMAASHDLGYLGDAEISSMYLGNFNKKVQATLSAIKDIVQQEQYIDFLTNRRFRHAILTHKENSALINRNINPQRLNGLYIQARYKPADGESENMPRNFVSTSNAAATFTTTDAATGVVIGAIGKMNRPVTAKEISDKLKKEKKIDPKIAEDLVQKNSLPLVLQNFMTMHSCAYDYCTEISKKPKAFAWTRHLITTMDKNLMSFTNMKCENVTLQPFHKSLLIHLDGKNTQPDLIDKMVKAVKSGEIKIQRQTHVITDEKEIRDILKEQVPAALNKLADLAFLEA